MLFPVVSHPLRLAPGWEWLQAGRSSLWLMPDVGGGRLVENVLNVGMHSGVPFGTAPAWAASEAGAVLRMVGAGAAHACLRVSHAQGHTVKNLQRFSVAVYFQQHTINLGTDFNRYLSMGAWSGNLDDAIVGGDANDYLVWRVHNGTTQITATDTGFTLTGKGLMLVVATYDGANLRLYPFNRPVVTAAQTGNLRLTASHETVLFGGPQSYHTAHGSVVFGAVLDEVLTEAQARAWQADPWAPFRVRRVLSLPQKARPVSTVAAGNWTSVGAATLHEAMDEATVDDADYGLSPAAPSNEAAEVDLGDLASPNPGDVTLRYRYRADA